MNTIVKMHEKVMENKNKELTNIKQKLKSSNIINQELSQKIEDRRIEDCVEVLPQISDLLDTCVVLDSDG